MYVYAYHKICGLNIKRTYQVSLNWSKNKYVVIQPVQPRMTAFESLFKVVAITGTCFRIYWEGLRWEGVICAALDSTFQGATFGLQTAAYVFCPNYEEHSLPKYLEEFAYLFILQESVIGCHRVLSLQKIMSELNQPSISATKCWLKNQAMCLLESKCRVRGNLLLRGHCWF